MTDAALLLASAGLICLGTFLNGIRFARMSEEKIRSRWTQIEMPRLLRKGRSVAEQFQLIGRILMIAAPLFFLFSAALCFGLLGPVDGMTPIRFQ
jgi:hypothetical protein